MGPRIAAVHVPAFMHGGLEVDSRWREMPEWSEKQRATLRDFHGRFIQVHSADRDKLRDLGLAFVADDKPLTDLKKNKETKTDAGVKTDAKKTDSAGGGK